MSKTNEKVYVDERTLKALEHYIAGGLQQLTMKGLKALTEKKYPEVETILIQIYESVTSAKNVYDLPVYTKRTKSNKSHNPLLKIMLLLSVVISVVIMGSNSTVILPSSTRVEFTYDHQCASDMCTSAQYTTWTFGLNIHSTTYSKPKGTIDSISRPQAPPLMITNTSNYFQTVHTDIRQNHTRVSCVPNTPPSSNTTSFDQKKGAWNMQTARLVPIITNVIVPYTSKHLPLSCKDKMNVFVNRLVQAMEPHSVNESYGWLYEWLRSFFF